MTSGKKVAKSDPKTGNRASLWTTVWHFSKVPREAIGGFVVLGIFLWTLSCLWPSAYNFLTQWANAPVLPQATECTVLEILPQPTPKLSAYKMQIVVASNVNGPYNILLAALNDYVSVYEVGGLAPDKHYDDGRNLLFKRFVASNEQRRKSFEIEVSVNHVDEGSKPFGVGSLEPTDCPIEVVSMRRRK